MNIASHNSGTGEAGHGWWSALLEPFSQCQDKTLVEQFREGVRLFDIRVRKRGDKWVFAHGLWESESPVGYALSDLNLEAFKAGEKAIIMVTYEGECPNKLEYISEVSSWDCYSWVEVAEINVKKPKWLTLARYKNVPFVQCFRVLDWSSWHTLIPIPRLWVKVEKAPRARKGKKYYMYDFI
jgi:hypothetical protein